MNTEQHLKRIQEKLQLLLKQHARLQKENELLQEELNSARQELAQCQEDADQLRQQVDILKLGNGEMQESDRKLFEKRINGYLREIDRCITLLGN